MLLVLHFTCAHIYRQGYGNVFINISFVQVFKHFCGLHGKDMIKISWLVWEFIMGVQICLTTRSAAKEKWLDTWSQPLLRFEQENMEICQIQGLFGW